MADGHTEQLIAAPPARPVTRDDPAWFITGNVSPRDPAYGTVHYYDAVGDVVGYSFDAEGRHFARLMKDGPKAGFVVIQNRAFRVVGPVGRAFLIGGEAA
ncbi:MAG: hypothetical protein ACK4RV_10395 [Caulobacter sp.]